MENELEKTANVETESKPVDSGEKDKQIKALEAEIAKLKQSVTNASADASKYKKELQARMTEEEKTRAEQEASNAARDAELEDLRTKWNVAEHEKQLISVGFSSDLANKIAGSLKSYKPEELTVLFDGIREFIETHDKELKAKSLMSNPVLPGGEAKKTMSKEQFNAMGYKERVKLFNEDPELYKEMTKTS